MAEPLTVRVLSYNVRSLRDDSRAVARVIRSCDPDVVCVQEAPRFLRWRSKCARLARESGLLFVTGGRPAGAMVLLASVRTRVVHHEDVLLPKTRRLHQRGLAIAVFDVAGARFGVASMHLGLDPTERVRHAREITARLAALPAPYAIVAGDLNETAGGAAWKEFTARFQDGYAVAPYGGAATMSARDPRRRIDAVFVDREVEVVRCGVPPATEGADLRRASDHLPVLAELRVPVA